MTKTEAQMPHTNSMLSASRIWEHVNKLQLPTNISPKISDQGLLQKILLHTTVY